ncbi:hypothetical protein PTTG_12447 [Puccinia triticina 1-1 BBBD Race 1]|uniref:Uncharacterized protein n=1 Tax=Puccinia triticina (isolate 1-1 / race 1 (BBBD)) TaxID=630390 RepID=A0A180G8J7_PUCT1|nr:hypothetical protein PTTG_12447 [Puccinia triticina 1-1 BBBD Race 1]
MPINLYANDTSGNVSKQWNKHISYYFTLAGLAPKLSNMQYNCHFLSTSNQAGVLELGEAIVEDLNALGTTGFVAHDVALDTEVLIMSVILCFQGDSPMHAKVTNTTLPNVSLNPCRMCCLHAAHLDDKKTVAYVQDFLCLDGHGRRFKLSLWIVLLTANSLMGRSSPQTSGTGQQWETIISQTANLWELGKNGVKSHFDDQTKLVGVRDNINRRFVEIMQQKDNASQQDEIRKMEEEDLAQLFNPFLGLLGFDGCLDTPVEILHVFLLGIVKYLTRDFIKGLKVKQLARIVASWDAINVDSLNITSIQAQYLVKHVSLLVGKDFKIVLQTAPFVLYQFMTDAQRALWISLGQLATYIFETHILHMKQYLADLRKHIDIFMWNLINTTAQWVNKPKFHMLMHLPESIEQFGPPTTFATEKFESFNSILRNASVHSNRHRPGRDLALSFLNFHALRLVVSNARLFNHHTRLEFYASNKVTDIFRTNPIIQKSMGYNHLLVEPQNAFPAIIHSSLTEADKQEIPAYFNQYPNARVTQICQLRLSEKDVVKRRYFVLVNELDGISHEYLIPKLILQCDIDCSRWPEM